MVEYNNYTNSNLKYLREKNKLTQQRMANDLKIDQSTLAKWEMNSRDITLKWAIEIAKYFKISIADFICVDLKKLDMEKKYEWF